MASDHVTMRDVAERAGVAVSTVSRVISRPARISPATREVVVRAMAELGYPRPVASAPIRPGPVVVAIPDLTNPFHFGLVRGTQERLRVAGHAQFLLEGPEDTRHALPGSEAVEVVGTILVSPKLSDDTIRAESRRRPLVVVNRIVPDVTQVLIDTAPAVEQAVEHLASLGHRRICYVAGPDKSWSNEQRWTACVGAGERLGLETLMRIGPFQATMAAGPAAADAVLNTGATAAIVFNDLMAIGMLRRFAARGVGVPDQVSVVGCDDIFGADFCHPALTTVTCPMDRAGRLAVDLLLDLLAGRRDRPQLTVPAHLTIRDSTGHPRLDRTDSRVRP